MIRESISDDHFSDEFKNGKNSAEAAVSDFLYQHVRCLVMHAGPTAKKGVGDVKDTYAPYDPDDWRKAAEVLPVVEAVAQLYVVYDLAMKA